MTDAEGNVTRLEYDTLGHNVILENPDAGRTESRFTPAGDLGAKITANLAAQGQQTRFLRTFHRLDRIDYPFMPDVVFTYGGPGAPENRANRVATVSDESGLEARSYGRLGETIRTVRTATAMSGTSPRGPYTMTYNYDSFNRLLSMTYPDGEVVTWTYDAGGKVKTAAGVFQGVRFDYLRHQGYDEFDQKVRTIYGNGVESRWTYDPQSRELAALQTQENGGRKIQDLTYRRDLTGTLLGLDNNLPPGRPKELGGPVTETYVYDDLYQLVAAQGTWRTTANQVSSYTLSLAYDAGGDLVAKNQLHQITTGNKPLPQQKTTYNWAYAYGGAHPHAPTHIGDRTLSYDLDGNQTGWTSDVNGTRRTNTWDEENRLKAVADNGQTTRFLYDSNGTRSNKAGQNGETIYVNRWFSVRNGSIASKHFFADDARLATKVSANANPSSEKLYFYQPDHLGSTHFVTDNLGKAWQHLEYFPGGEVWADERSQSESTPFLFSGNELDEETGLYDYGFRYYDGRQGQWISADPLLGGLLETTQLARPQPTHRPFRLSGLVYGYAGNSPTNRTDDLGLEEADPETAKPSAEAEAEPPATAKPAAQTEPAQQANAPAQQQQSAAGEKPKIEYPPDDGFQNGESETTTLQPGTLVDRYGGSFDKETGEFIDKGNFLAPEGTPYEERALPPGTNEKTYSVYEVLKPIEGVKAGLIAPWFGEKGGGVQYTTGDKSRSIGALIQGGYLRLVTRTPGK